MPISLALGDDGLACWPGEASLSLRPGGAGLARAGHGQLGAGRKFRLGSPRGARDKGDKGRSDLALPVTLSAALETRSALGVALYRLLRLSLSLPYTLSLLGEYVRR